MPKPFYLPAGILLGIVALALPREALAWAHPGASDELLGRLSSAAGLYLKTALATLAVYLLVLGRVARTPPTPAHVVRIHLSFSARVTFSGYHCGVGSRVHPCCPLRWYFGRGCGVRDEVAGMRSDG